MIILDTDHVVVLKYRDSPQAKALSANMAASLEPDFAISAVTIEEQMRGWLALIHHSPEVHRQLPAYERLVELFDFFSRWKIVPFDRASADEFVRLRKQKIRIGTMDLKIAATALVHDALLVSANRRDFEQVPDLRLENWLL
ncbi:MAG: type II toxin-antitoxin system VapC family toxin [Planctomycetota bacterium]|nr:type II toxin-antitoxin system VapC family toxin [Planctomycetota bacterium]